MKCLTAVYNHVLGQLSERRGIFCLRRTNSPVLACFEVPTLIIESQRLHSAQRTSSLSKTYLNIYSEKNKVSSSLYADSQSFESSRFPPLAPRIALYLARSSWCILYISDLLHASSSSDFKASESEIRIVAELEGPTRGRRKRWRTHSLLRERSTAVTTYPAHRWCHLVRGDSVGSEEDKDQSED